MERELPGRESLAARTYVCFIARTNWRDWLNAVCMSGSKWLESGNYCNDRTLCVSTAGFRGYGRELFVSDVTAVLVIDSMPN